MKKATAWPPMGKSHYSPAAGVAMITDSGQEKKESAFLRFARDEAVSKPWRRDWAVSIVWAQRPETFTH